MTKYRDILRLHSLGISQQNIAYSCSVSKKTVNRIINRTKEIYIAWPLDDNPPMTYLMPWLPKTIKKTSLLSESLILPTPIKSYLKNGVSKNLLWTEYLGECRLSGTEPLMYSQFCYHIQQDEQKCRATMHINRKRRTGRNGLAKHSVVIGGFRVPYNRLPILWNCGSAAPIYSITITA